MNTHQHDNIQNKTTVTEKKFWQTAWFKNVLTIVVFVAVYLSIRPFMQGNVIHGQAPAMQVTSITGQEINLQNLNQQGKPVLIHFWATWCGICEFSKESIEALAKDYSVINIATQSADDEQLLSYAAEHNLNPNIIVNDLDGTWMKRFGAKAVPADFIIDSNGNISFIEVGYTSGWGLRFRLWWASLTEPKPLQTNPNQKVAFNEI